MSTLNIKITKREALEKTATLFRWLAKNASVEHVKTLKVEYFIEFGLPRVLNHCYCCAHVRQDHEELNEYSCKDCPMVVAWPNGCETTGSPYERWCRATTDEEQAAIANEIARLADVEIAKLDAAAPPQPL